MDNFKIIGISIETTNENGQSMIDVEKIWGKFWGENISDKIPNRESDYTGKYTLIIGFSVSTLDNIPNEFIGREIHIGKNKKYVSKGKMPEAIVKTWTEIWQEQDLKRAYRADVTVHGKKYYDGDNAEVETYISIIE